MEVMSDYPNGIKYKVNDTDLMDLGVGPRDPIVFGRFPTTPKEGLEKRGQVPQYFL